MYLKKETISEARELKAGKLSTSCDSTRWERKKEKTIKQETPPKTDTEIQ